MKKREIQVEDADLICRIRSARSFSTPLDASVYETVHLREDAADVPMLMRALHSDLTASETDLWWCFTQR